MIIIKYIYIYINESGATPTAMLGRRSTQRHRGDFSLKTRTDVWVEEYILQCYYDGWKRHLRASRRRNCGGKPGGRKINNDMQRKFGKKLQKYRKYRHRVPVAVLVYYIHRDITMHFPPLYASSPARAPSLSEPMEEKKKRKRKGKSGQVSSYLERRKFTQCPFNVPGRRPRFAQQKESEMAPASKGEAAASRWEPRR